MLIIVKLFFVLLVVNVNGLSVISSYFTFSFKADLTSGY